MGDGTNVVAAGQQFLTLLGSIFAAFFLLSLAVETILENFRGFLAIFGITWLKSKKTLQEGINEVADLVSGDQKEVARFQALLTFVEKTSTDVGNVTGRINDIRGDLERIVDPSGKLAIVDREKEWITAITAPIKAKMDASEDKRVFVLRIISTLIGIGVSWAVQINVSDMIRGGADNHDALHVFGYIIGGLAAAGGSSFWHDQLDKVRSAKSIAAKLV